MIVLLTGVPSLFKSAVARMLAARTGFTFHPLHDPVERASFSGAAADPAVRKENLESLKRRLGRTRHFVSEDLFAPDELRKLSDAGRGRLFVVRVRDHEAETRHGLLSVARPGKAPLYATSVTRRYDERAHRRSGEVDLEIHTAGKDPSESVWWILSSGQFVSTIGDEGIQITVSDPPAEDASLRENLVRNAGSHLVYECLYCNETYLREHVLRLDPVRYLLDGVLCMPWSCQWCWGMDTPNVNQDEALTQAEEAEQVFSEANEFLARGDAPAATRHYLRASEFAPSYDGIYANLAVAYAAQGEATKALAEIARAVRLHPTHVLHRYAQAMLFEDAGKPTEAAREWKAVRRLVKRAHLSPLDFTRMDLSTIVAEAETALSVRLAAFAGTADDSDAESFSECEQAVLRAEDHYRREEFREALSCLDVARELYVKESGEPMSPQLFQRINRLLGECYQKISGGGTATREAPRFLPNEGRAPRKPPKPRRKPNRGSEG